MKQKFAFALVTLAGLGFALPAAAEIDVQGLVDQLTANGYQVRETYTEQNQLRVEAVYGTQRVEMVYDSATGRLLSQESSSGTQDGVQVGTGDGSEDDNGDDDNGDDDNGDDDNGDDDNGNDDNGNDDSGSDDSGDDDSGSDDSGSDDSGSDDSGSDDSGSDDSGSDDN